MSEEEKQNKDESSHDRDTQNLLAIIYETQKQQKLHSDLLKQQKSVINNFQGIVVQEARNAVTEATQKAFSDSSRFIVEKARELEALNKEITSNLERFKFKSILVWLSTSIAFFIAFFILVMIMVPSLDEIKERKAYMEKTEKYLAQFKEKDGKVLVRIMSKKPCYGLEGTTVDDWCEIDPKKK